MTDGLKLLYVDCGANTGWTLGNAIASQQYDRFVAIEPNPELWSGLKHIAWAATGTRVSVLQKAVWTQDGSGRLYLARQWSENYRGGSTILAGKLTGHVDYDHPVGVLLMDFPNWLEQQLSNLGGDWRASVKMDIEGAEYAVLEAMFDRGVMPLVAELRVEFHADKFSTIPRERHDRLLLMLADWAGPGVQQGDTFLWRK